MQETFRTITAAPNRTKSVFVVAGILLVIVGVLVYMYIRTSHVSKTSRTDGPTEAEKLAFLKIIDEMEKNGQLPNPTETQKQAFLKTTSEQSASVSVPTTEQKQAFINSLNKAQ